MRSRPQQRTEVERLTTMRDRLLMTLNEQGAARAKDYDTMRGMLAELAPQGHGRPAARRA
ncbi:hypothetical protein ACWCPD_25770 [Streptomyces sp. NPDC001935]